MSEAANEQALKNQLAEATQAAREGDLDTAIGHLKAILGDAPEHVISLGMLASIYLQIGMLDEAIELFRKLLQEHPQNPLGRFQLGMCYLTKGDTEQALTVWEPMLADQEDFMAHFHSALALLERNEHHRSYELIQVAAHRMPTNHPLYPQLLDVRSNLVQTLESSS